MSHIAEEYAKNLGVKIGEPALQEHYFPVLDSKYIVIYNDCKSDSKKYSYFDELLFILRPALDKLGYKIYHISDGNAEYIKHTNRLLEGFSYKQMAYIIKNSSMYLGVNSAYMHIASKFNVPIAAVFSNVLSAHLKPIWSDNNELIDSPKKMASFSNSEKPKTINKLNPEDIASKVFSLLNIEPEIKFKTIHKGNKYEGDVVQIVPDFFNTAILNPIFTPNIFLRADLNPNMQNMSKWLQKFECAIISDTILPLDFLKAFSQNIIRYHINIDEEKEVDINGLNAIKRAGVDLVLDSKVGGDKLRRLREKYFDFEVYEDFSEATDLDLTGKKFFTKKPIFSNGLKYPSEAHWRSGKNILDNEAEILDNKTFKNEMDYFYIYED
jgi:hypothetical protein